MKQILITKEQFHNMVSAAMTEYTDKMKSREDEEHKYSRLMELTDVLTLSIGFSLLEYNLFNKGGESDEQ